MCKNLHLGEGKHLETFANTSYCYQVKESFLLLPKYELASD